MLQASVTSACSTGTVSRLPSSPTARATASTASAGATNRPRSLHASPAERTTELRTVSRARPLRPASGARRGSAALETTGHAWREDAPIVNCSGVQKSCVCRATDGSIFLPFDLDASLDALLEERYLRPAAADHWPVSRVAPTTGPSRCCPIRCGSRCAVAFDVSRSEPPFRPGRPRPRCIGSRRGFSAMSRRSPGSRSLDRAVARAVRLVARPDP